MGAPQGGGSDCPLAPWGAPKGHPGAQGVENGSTKNAVNLCQPAANLFVHGVSHKFADFGPFWANFGSLVANPGPKPIPGNLAQNGSKN